MKKLNNSIQLKKYLNYLIKISNQVFFIIYFIFYILLYDYITMYKLNIIYIYIYIKLLNNNLFFYSIFFPWVVSYFNIIIIIWCWQWHWCLTLVSFEKGKKHTDIMTTFKKPQMRFLVKEFLNGEDFISLTFFLIY
jgi:hypothetical protein